MKKSLFSILSLLLCLSGCNKITNSETISSNVESIISESISNSENNDAVELESIISSIKEELPKELSTNLDMSIFEKYENTTINISSSNKEILGDDGTYTKPENDTDVTLKITVKYNEESNDFSHVIKVKGYTVDEKIEYIKEQLVLSNEEVTSSFNLPSINKYNATINWESSNVDFLVINENVAEVTRPIETFEDEEITLTATISIDGKTSQKSFIVKVLALKVESIELSATPSNLYVPLNASEMDTNGGIVLVTLDDGSTKEVSLKKDMITSFDSSKVGECEVIVEYCGKSTSFISKVYKPSVEKVLAINETKTADFESELEPNIVFDNAMVPNSKIISGKDALSNNSSLYIESDGNFNCIYLKDYVKFEANSTYQINFKYKVLELTDTIYFQIADTGKFTQFGNSNTLNTVQELSWLYKSNINSSIIQIFPGQNVGKTKLIIDDLSVTKIPSENNVVSSLVNNGDYVLETFGDVANSIFRIDNSQTPNTSIIKSGIEACSLSFVSPGGFACVYLVPNTGLLKVGNSYKVSFDYIINEFSDTIYFQYYNGNTPTFTQFGNVNQIGQLQHFEYDIKVTDSNFLFQIFPGASTKTTSLLIDNFRIEKIGEPIVEENVYKTSLDNIGDYVLETFGDTKNPILRVDVAPAPSSSVIKNGIEGTSLSIVSPGKHQGIYLVPNSGLLKENTSYEVSFDYRINTLADTIYFQYYNFGEATFTQFGNVNQIGQVAHFKYDITITDPTCFFHIFPGSASAETKLLIDNVIIKKLNVYTDDIFFKQRDTYVMEKALNVMPKTFEANIHINQNQTTGGVILGNYCYDSNSINYEIVNGKVKVVYSFKDNTKEEFVFDLVNVKSSDFVHLAIVKDSTKLHCYLNGVLKQSLDCLVDDFVCDNPFTIGGDNSSDNPLYFKGRIHSITLYDDVRTADEILSDATEVNLNDSNLLVHYNLKDKVGATKIEDEKNNIDVKLLGLWLDEAPQKPDYTYSFAVVGDTQILTCFYPEELHNIYDYISGNVESENIKHVFGLGDITDKNTDSEWQLAVQEITKLDGKVSYSLVRGNHDGQDNFNKYFGSDTSYSNQYSEMYNNDTNNTIHYFSAGNLDYMVVALDIGASDDIINWVSNEIEKHPNHNVIITTHAHLNSDGSYLESSNLLAPSNLGGVNNGADLEEKLIKKYENIVLVMCGHISVDGVIKTTLTGEHGNKVTQLLINPQGIDYEIGPTGLVAMLYFSEDGSTVNLQYYSTVHEKYKRNGQISFELNTIKKK